MDDSQTIDRAKLDLLRQELGANFARILGEVQEQSAKSIAANEGGRRTRRAGGVVGHWCGRRTR